MRGLYARSSDRQSLLVLLLMDGTASNSRYSGTNKVKVVLFLSQVTSRSVLGKESVAKEIAFAESRELPRSDVVPFRASFETECGESESTTEHHLPKKITQTLSCWPLLEVSRPHRLYSKDNP